MAPVPTPSIFDFEAWPNYDPEKAAAALRDHPELYVNHLTIAKRLEEWASRMPAGDGTTFHDGTRDTLNEVASHLRATHYLPGSSEFRGIED